MVDDSEAGTDIEIEHEEQGPNASHAVLADFVEYKYDEHGNIREMYVYVPKPDPRFTPFLRKDILEGLDPHMNHAEKCLIRFILQTAAPSGSHSWRQTKIAMYLKKAPY